ncbi:MAG: putative ABC transporter permease [Huintestinicola sp.]|uniref:putative ABC transporter permease n=1 Tax=Huintestinicola sp. TaxID=2981661 RepID=UPI003F0AB308
MQTIPYIGYSLYQMFLMFCFWSFVGWCIEVIDMTYETGEYQNRGFLNMPICPIEGLGVIMVTVLFRPISHTIVPLFFACTILCTAFELFVGWGMEKLFHARWWDYSHMKFNYKGYICLRNSIFFGAGCVVVIRWIQPMVEKAIDAIPINVGMTIVIIMAVLIAVDTFVSLMAVKKLNERFRRIDEISKLMLSGSVKVGMKLASGTLKVKSNVDRIIDVKDNVVEKVQDMNSANMDRLRSEYSRLVEEKDAFTERLAKTLISHKYSESLRAVKDKLRGRMTETGISDEDDENE